MAASRWFRVDMLQWDVFSSHVRKSSTESRLKWENFSLSGGTERSSLK